MGKKIDSEDKAVIEQFYTNLGRLLDERGIMWKDLALLMGISANSLSSMKSQRINPSLDKLLQIAEVLEVSVDELIGTRQVSQGLYDVFWTMPTEIKSLEKQDQICESIMQIINATNNTSPASSSDRRTACARYVRYRLEEAIRDKEIEEEKRKRAKEIEEKGKAD